MFYTLHRIVKALLVGAVLASFFLAYQYRAVFEPVTVWIEVLRNRSAGGADLTDVPGVVTHVLDGSTVQVKGDDGRRYNFRLTGLVPADLSRSEGETSGQPTGAAKDFLEDLLRSNRVTIRVTFASPEGSGLGLVYLNGTNLNASLVRSGRAGLNREYIQKLPLLEQYRLIDAQREASRREQMPPGPGDG